MRYYIIIIFMLLLLPLKATLREELFFAGESESRALIALKNQIDSGEIKFEDAGTRMREILLETSKSSNPVLHSALAKILPDSEISFFKLMSNLSVFLSKLVSYRQLPNSLYKFPLPEHAEKEITYAIAATLKSSQMYKRKYVKNTTLFMPMVAGQEIGLFNFYMLMANGINPGGLILGSTAGHGGCMASNSFYVHDCSHHTTISDLLLLWSIYFKMPMASIFKNMQTIGHKLHTQLKNPTTHMRAEQCLFGLTYLIHESYIEYFSKIRMSHSSRSGHMISEIEEVAAAGIPLQLSDYLRTLYQLVIQNALGKRHTVSTELLESLNCQFKIDERGSIEIMSFTQPLYDICSAADFKICLAKLLKQRVKIDKLSLTPKTIYDINTSVIWSIIKEDSAALPSAKRIRKSNIMDVTFTITSALIDFSSQVRKKFSNVSNYIDWQLVDIMPFLEIFGMMDLPQSDGTSKTITVESTVVEKAAVYKNAMEKLSIILDAMIDGKLWEKPEAAA